MQNLNIKYATYVNALPPRPIRIDVGGWSGPAEKMVDGSNPQPWHCLPFIEGSTYGLELLYPFETPCDIVNDGGTVRIECDVAKEPGGTLTGFEFVLFSPVQAAKYYLFNTRIDVQPPPGYALRTEPHPRFFTDETNTFPLAMIGHLQNEWYPRLAFVVFRAPQPGQRHHFRKGQPYAQILFVPKQVNYELSAMTPEEEKRRRDLERGIQDARLEIAENHWRPPDGVQFNNHYKVLARAYARDGLAGVEETVRVALAKRELAFPLDKTIPEYLAMGVRFMNEKKLEHAHMTYAHILSLDPDNAEAVSQLGILFASFGGMLKGLELMTAAAALAPNVSRYHWNLAELQRQLGRLQEAEASIRAVLRLVPNDPGALSLLAVLLAQQGRTAEGLEAYRAASAVGFPYPDAHAQMGDALAQHGHWHEARTCYETALSLRPDFAPAQRGLQDLLAKMNAP